MFNFNILSGSKLKMSSHPKNKKSETKFMKANHIYIFASELSNLVGMNKFKKPAEVLLRIWKTNFAQEHSCILKELEKDKRPVAIDETKEQTFQRIAKKYEDKTVKIQQEMEKCKKTKDVKKMKESQEKIIAHCQDLEAEDKVKIENAIREITQTNFGTRQEKKSLHIYTQLTNTPVLELKYFCKRPLIQSQDDIWFLGGKIDGILEDKTIIEVKNRMRGLFNTVREYEKIQTFAYMFILHSQCFRFFQLNSCFLQTSIKMFLHFIAKLFFTTLCFNHFFLIFFKRYQSIF